MHKTPYSVTGFNWNCLKEGTNKSTCIWVILVMQMINIQWLPWTSFSEPRLRCWSKFGSSLFIVENDCHPWVSWYCSYTLQIFPTKNQPAHLSAIQNLIQESVFLTCLLWLIDLDGNTMHYWRFLSLNKIRLKGTLVNQWFISL